LADGGEVEAGGDVLFRRVTPPEPSASSRPSRPQVPLLPQPTVPGQLPDFCTDALQEAIARYGAPEIFNTDQGWQFTSAEFTGVLKEHGVRISMDGKGRWLDNVFVERLWRSVKYEEVVCYERSRYRIQRLRCFTRDEGRPLEVGLREQASNRHKLRWLRATVVSVDGKGGEILCQVGIKETNASEPLMTCRNVQTGVETGAWTSAPRSRLGGNPFTAQLAPGMKAA
jgi:hypothetical protein